MYKYYNANPFGNHVEDCTVRALSAAENISYDQAYRELSDFARKRGLMMSSVESVEKFLDSRYDRVCFDGITLGDFIEEHPRKRYLVTMRGHITAVINGTCIDTFDPRKRIIWCAWEVPRNATKRNK